MDNQDKRQETFSYTYSAAKPHEDIQRIREKYMPKEQDKMEQLRRLDRSVTEKGIIAALTIGTIGILLLGVGIYCSFVWKGTVFLPGIIIVIAGIAISAAAYPLFLYIVKRERKKVAPEILRMADELIN